MTSHLPTSSNLVQGTLALAELQRGEHAVVMGLAEDAQIDAGRDAGDSLLRRLRDLGFVPGMQCQVLARMWPGGDPMVVRIGGSTFALRRAEAAAIRVLRARERDFVPVRVPHAGPSAATA